MLYHRDKKYVTAESPQLQGQDKILQTVFFSKGWNTWDRKKPIIPRPSRWQTLKTSVHKGKELKRVIFTNQLRLFVRNLYWICQYPPQMPWSKPRSQELVLSSHRTLVPSSEVSSLIPLLVSLFLSSFLIIALVPDTFSWMAPFKLISQLPSIYDIVHTDEPRQRVRPLAVIYSAYVFLLHPSSFLLYLRRHLSIIVLSFESFIIYTILFIFITNVVFSYNSKQCSSGS